MLSYALAWAARGFKVFPLRPKTNEPYGKGDDGQGWIEKATTDADTIRGYWGAGQQHNIGVSTTGLIVVDVDVKDGRLGMDSLLLLDLPMDTLTVRTPSGGWHIYFSGPDRKNSAGTRLGKGIDVRAYHGYVVAPGSVTPKGRYVIDTDAPVRVAPPHLVASLDAPKEKVAGEVQGPEDTPEQIEFAIHRLANEVEAPEKGSRNDALFRAACAVKDIGISEAKAIELIEAHWLPRLPPAPGDEIERPEIEKTVGSAYANGLLPQGSASPQALTAGMDLSVFAAAEKAAPEPAKAAAGLSGLLNFRPLTPMEDLKPRPWVIRRMAIKGYVTTVIGPGGVSKSTLLMTIAAHAAVSRGFGGFELAKEGPLRSIVISNEDDRSEMEKRLYACCIAHGLNPRDVERNVMLLPGSEYFFKIADGDRQAKVREGDLRLLGQKCREHDISLAFVDPLIETHDFDVNDNSGLKAVMAVYRKFAQGAEVAAVLAQHSSKGAARNGRAGDADASLGAGSVTNSSRIAFTLMPATSEDAKTYSLPPGQLGSYVRLDDAKMNLAAMSALPVWFRRDSVDLLSGDSIGVLKVADVKQNAMAERQRIATVIAAELDARNIVSASSFECVKLLCAADPIFVEDNEGAVAKTLQRKIEKVLSTGFELGDGRTIRHVVEKPSATQAARNIIQID